MFFLSLWSPSGFSLCLLFSADEIWHVYVFVQCRSLLLGGRVCWSCLVFSELLRSVVWYLSLILEYSWLLLLHIFSALFSLFSRDSIHAYVMAFAIAPQFLGALLSSEATHLILDAVHFFRECIHIKQHNFKSSARRFQHQCHICVWFCWFRGLLEVCCFFLPFRMPHLCWTGLLAVGHYRLRYLVLYA